MIVMLGMITQYKKQLPIRFVLQIINKDIRAF